MRPAVGEIGHGRPAIAAIERHVELLVIATGQMQSEGEAGAAGHRRLGESGIDVPVILKAQQHATVAVFLAVDFVAWGMVPHAFRSVTFKLKKKNRFSNFSE